MNWKRFLGIMFALLATLSISANRLAAQTNTTGDITGVVTDQTGAVVPDASVSLKDNTKGNIQQASTGKDGVYHFYLLSPGSYTVSVDAKGFSAFSRTTNVAVGQVEAINIQLSLGSSAISVTVTEAAPLVQTENGDTSTALSQSQIANVPNPGNDLSAIVQLAPGVIANTSMGDGNVEAFGMPATSNLFTLDGMADNDPFLNLNNSGASNLLLGSNEIQEADVVTNGYSANYGTFAGINVNYVTKSGGNDFHGNAVYYWNGSALNANDWLHNDAGQAKPFSNANQWAASLGGPIKKDKMFFFLNTEGLRVLIPVPTQLSLPSPQFEAATIANLNTNGLAASVPFYCQGLPICSSSTAAPGSGSGIFNLYNAVPGYSTAQNSFGTTATGPGGTAPFTAPGCGSSLIPGFFANTQAAAAALSPCALSLLSTPINFAPEWQLAGRFDWNIGANDRMYLRMQYDNGTQPTFTDPVSPVFNSESIQPEYQGQLNETHVFNPTLTNQFLLAATWYSAIFKSVDQSAATAAFPGTLELNDGSLSSIGGIGFVFPQGRNVTQYQVSDDVSKSFGMHTLRFGATLHKNYVSDHDNGFFTNPLVLPLSLGSFYAGGDDTNPASGGSVFIQHFPESTNLPIRLYEVAGYVQDDIKLRSNFTLSPGLRIEHASNPVCVTLCFAQFSAPFADIVANPTAPYNEQIATNQRNALLSYQAVQWEPRLSFAWQPFSSSTNFWKSNFVVRGGAGIFYDIFPGTVADNISQNPPLDNPFQIASAGIGGTCTGFLSPNQTPGANLYNCATAANAAFVTAFNTGANTTTFAPNLTFTQPKTQAPQFDKWSLEIQKGFGANDSIDIGFNGNHGLHIPVINSSINAFGFFPQLPAAAPTSQFGSLTEIQSAGISNYNGLTVSFKHRFSGLGGGVVQVNYTWSHALDDVSNGGFLPFQAAVCSSCTGSIQSPQNPYYVKGNYGPADYDVRHSVNANYVWQIPVRRALMGHGWAPLVDGWQVAGTVFYRTGFPFSVEDPSFTAVNNYNGVVLPDPVGAVSSINCAGGAHAGTTGTPCAFTNNFASYVQNPGSETTLVNGLRNSFRGPGYFDTDFSVSKKTAIPHWERGALQIGFQFFNLFNHPNFATPNNSISDPFFGTIQTLVNPPTSILGSFLGGDASPRLIQVKAAITF